MNQTNYEYLKALQELNKAEEVKPRDMKVKELLCYTMKLDAKYKLIELPGFETNENYAHEELSWYLAATNRIDFSPLIEKTWKKFSDDGLTVNSAYGHRIFGSHELIKINQWQWVKDKLCEDRDSRQAIINLNSAFDKEKKTKDFICTIALQFFIRNNSLNMITYMRSQDIYYGTRNDIYCFMSMQEMMAKELDVSLGNYYHVCGSLHIYEKHFKKIEKLLKDIKIKND